MEDIAVSADGIPIHFAVYGERMPALVFVHGWSCDRGYWENQIVHFAQRCKVATIDLAGHGESGIERKAWTIPAFGRDVVAVVERLGVEQVVLIGHSIGGLVIVEAARRMPQKVIGLVGVETFRNLEQTRTREMIDEALVPFQANFGDAVRQFVRSNQFVPSSDPVMVETIVEDMAAAPPDVGVGILDGVWSHDAALREGLRQVESPVFLINADHRPTDIEIAGRYGIRVEIISGASHFLMIEAPDLFNRRLEELVEELRQPGNSGE